MSVNLTPPKWAPKDRTAPLKEEYLFFYREVTRYHDRVEGNLADEPDLVVQLLDVPDALEVFTDKMAIVVAATDLLQYLSDVRSLHDEARRKRVERATPAATISGSTDTERGGPKVALPTQFDGSATNARTFLAECNNYIMLNRTRFPTDSVKIQWALQLCTGKAANWKRIQLELAETYDTPEHLMSWVSFQENFRLKWADLNSKEKAQQRFFAGVKQTGSVRRYAEIFEDVILEAEFENDAIVAAAFYTGLKYEVKRDLVGRRPHKLEDLKALAITLDEERMAAHDPDRRESKPKPVTRASEAASSSRPETTPRQSTPEVKAETARIGTRLSEEERERRMREGRCFDCGEKGHRRPDCPRKTSRAQVAAMEPNSDPTLEANPTHEEPKN